MGHLSRSPAARYRIGTNAQPDELQFAAIRAANRGGYRDFGRVTENLDSKNIPPQLRQTPYLQTIAVKSKPFLLIPTNPKRMSFVLSGENLANAFFSYGYPIIGNAGLLFGIAIPAGSFFMETGGTVSIDDIWVFSNNVEDVNKAILGYEGLLAVESLGHKQAQGS